MKYRVNRRHDFPTDMPAKEWLALHDPSHPEYDAPKLGALAVHENVLCVVIRYQGCTWAIPIQNLDASAAWQALPDGSKETALEWRQAAWDGKFKKALDAYAQRNEPAAAGMF